MVPKHDDHPSDIPRSRIAAAAFLFALAGVGVVTNLATNQERFSIAFCTTLLVAATALLNVTIANLRGGK